MADDVTVNPFSYKTMTFLEWMREIENNPLFDGKPQWLKVLLAARADILASYIDARANDTIFPTMFTKQSVYNFAWSLDYWPSTPIPASGEVLVTLAAGTSLPHVITKDKLKFQTSDPVGDFPVYFSGFDDVVMASLVQNVQVREGAQYSDTQAYQTTGAEFEEFIVDRIGLVKGSSSISINGEVWEEVNNFYESISTDKHYRILYHYDGSVRIRSGNGVYGAKFPAGFNPVVTAWYGGGTRGNVGIGKVNLYTGEDSAITGLTNLTRMSGGSAEESIDKIKQLAPLLVKAQDRCVSKEDFKAVTLTHNGVTRAYVQPNYYGVLTVRIQVVPNGGGEASSILKEEVTQLVKNKTLLSGIFVEVDTADYEDVDISMEATLDAGYVWSYAEPYLQLAVYFGVSEVLYELKESVKAQGMKSTVDYINILWGFTFDSADEDVLRQIEAMLAVSEVLDWSEKFWGNKIYSICDTIRGVNEINLIEPATIAVIPVDKLASIGSITIVEADKPERIVEDAVGFTTFAYPNMELFADSGSSVGFVTATEGEVV